ncbi:hypothetical protein BGZ82_005863 [Podila clonocystis]|nr:hypothetical protein BGZ82_005863 [Podila clonocystis]
MHFTKAIVAIIVAILAIALVTEASPIPKAIEACAPSKPFMAEEVEEHHLFKRAVPGANDWNCKPMSIHRTLLFLSMESLPVAS